MAKYNIFFSTENTPERKVTLEFRSDAKVIEYIDAQVSIGPELGEGQCMLDDHDYYVRKVGGKLFADHG